jgi:aspartate aminotransferase
VSQKIRLASRLDAVKPSATLAISQRAAELRGKGVDVISFGVGEPDFESPQHVRDAVKKAVDHGVSHSTAVRGTMELRKAICRDSEKRRRISHAPDEVVVTVGAKHALFNLALALYDEGDEVIIPAPYWVSYPEQVHIVGAKAVIVDTTEEEHFRLSPEKLAAAITPKTRALVLCTPSNPTGAAYREEDLRALAEVIRGKDFVVIVDEIYARLVYGGFVQKSLLELAPDLKDRVVIVDGVSKTYAMTGWRIGWLLAPKAIATACDTIQSQSTTNPSAIAQVAAIAALEGPEEELERMRGIFDERRRAMVEGLRKIPGIKCAMPDGAFYAFPNVAGLYGKRAGDRVLKTDIDVAAYLLDEASCAAVPGEPFGAPGYLRLSYATSRVAEGLARIDAAVRKLA